MDLPTELLELVLVAVADPWSLRSLSLTCRRLAAATGAASPLWRALLATNMDLTPLPEWPTEWETEFFCYWDGSYGDVTDEVAFRPPLTRVRGWTGGDLPTVPTAIVEQMLAEHETAAMVPGEAQEYGELTRDGGIVNWGLGRPSSRDESPSEQEDVAEARPPKGSFVYVDNRPSGTGMKRSDTAGDTPAASGDPAWASCEDDPRTLYIALATLSRAAAAVHAAPQFDHGFGWGSEASAVWHLLAVRVVPGSLSWPSSARTPTRTVKAAADSLMAAAGADPRARSPIYPRRGGVTCTKNGEPWSGRPAGALLHRYVVGPSLRHLMGLERNRRLLRRWQWSPRMRPTHAAAFAALDAVFGERPALAFQFGDDAMNPTGGVMAVQWTPSLVVGVLLPVVST